MVSDVRPMTLPDRVRAAKRAVQAAGFMSGAFKPRGSSLTLDVIVPVEFPDLSMTESELVGHLMLLIHERVTPFVHTADDETDWKSVAAHLADITKKDVVASVHSDPRPSDMRTSAGREWKKRHRAGATA